MRRLVLLILVLSGLGYLAMDWRSRSDAARAAENEDGSLARRPTEPAERSQESRQPQAARTATRPTPEPRPTQQPPASQEQPQEQLQAETSQGGGSAQLTPVQEPEPVRFPGNLVDPLALPTTLLEAWRTRDAELLQRFLNEGPGKNLPEGRVKLMIAFWRALTGDGAAARDLIAQLEGDSSVTSAQLQMARLAAGETGPQEASFGSDPLARAMRIVVGEVSAEQRAKAADARGVAENISDLMILEIGAPWAPRTPVLEEWAGRLEQAQSGHRMDPAGAWPHIEYEVQSGDSLVMIRKKVMQAHPGLKVCVGLIREVNGTGEFIYEGDVLRIPTAETRVVVDLDARMLMYMHGDEVVRAWKVGIGREGQETPIGEWTVGEKLSEPDYMPIGKEPLPYGHPDNPLGSRWLGLYRGGQDTSYGIHGTGEPDSVGGQVSEGCVRMRNGDVEQLFDLLPLHSRVRIQP